MILDELYESPQSCPECGGPAFSNLLLAEKKDACYNKVRSRYKVWPSAYASGALVQCRKKGASNWGNKSKNEGVAEGSDNIGSMIQQYEDMVELVYDLPPGRKKNIAIDRRDALETQIEAMPGGKEALRQWAKSYNDAMDEGVAEGGNPVDHEWYRKQQERKAKAAKRQDQQQRQSGVAEASKQKLTIGSKVLHPVHGEGTVVMHSTGGGNMGTVVKFANGKKFKVDHKKLSVSEAQLDEKCWDTHRQAGMKKKGDRMVPNCVPKEGVAEGDKVGNMDADRFDDAMSRLKKLAAQGPRKTVWDPEKRVYKTVPVNPQPK